MAVILDIADAVVTAINGDAVQPAGRCRAPLPAEVRDGRNLPDVWNLSIELVGL
jgi:hypothetical protein